MFHLLIFVNYALLFLCLIVSGYQYIRTPNSYRLIGLITMFIITILYMIGVIFFPHSSFFIPLTLPPAAFLFIIYYLTYPEKRNRILTAIAAILVVFFVVTYLAAVINP